MRIRLLMDNVSAVYYINKMGGTKSPVLAQLAIDLWQWPQPQFSVEGSSHSRGVECQSRSGVTNLARPQRWQLSRVVFNRINQTWGPLELDLFASRLSAQLSRFVSWRPDPGAEAFDAFSLDWSKVRGYAFPPFALVGRCLRQVLAQGVPSLVLVVPWYPLLLDLCVANPLLIPSFSGLLSMQGRVHPLANLQLAAATISQSHTEAGVSKSTQNLLLVAWRKGTSDPGVLQGKLIQFEQISLQF